MSSLVLGFGFDCFKIHVIGWELVLAFTVSDYKPYQDHRCPGPLGIDGNIEPGDFSIILRHQNTHS